MSTSKLGFGKTLSRREAVKLLGAGVAGATMGPAFTVVQATSATKPAGKVITHTTGGAAEEGYRKSWYEPFTAATGMEVVLVVTDVAKIVAMVQSGRIQIDVPNQTAYATVLLERQGALEKLDHSKFKLTNLSDLERVEDYWLSKLTYATVLGYNTKVFPERHPASWAEFWDVKAFPGRRMLQDAAAEYPNLEFALLADGVPMDKVHPIDIDRAFKKLQEIRKSIVKFWESGAVAAQMLSDRVVDLGSIWDSRIMPLIDAGAPVAIEWNQAMRNLHALSITKNAPNLENGYKFIDFGMQPKIQADIARYVHTSPANRKAFNHIDKKFAATLSTSPEHAKVGFVNNARWWAENYAKVAERWREFLLGG